MTTRSPKGPRVTLNVNQEIIDRSVPRDSKHCMIADAIKESYPSAVKISVDLATIRFSDPPRGLRYTYLTPRIAQVELVKFDQGKKPSPFTMSLRNAHVTRAGTSHYTKRTLSPKQQAAAKERAEHMDKVLKRTGLRKELQNGHAKRVPERVGGKTPPMQKTKDDVPFTRRRAFGLRALEF